MSSTFARFFDSMTEGTVCKQCHGSGKVKNPKYSNWEIYTGSYLPWAVASDPIRNGTWEQQEAWDMRAGAPPRRIDCQKCQGTGYMMPERRPGRHRERNRDHVMDAAPYRLSGRSQDGGSWITLEAGFNSRKDAVDYLFRSHRDFVRRYGTMQFCVESEFCLDAQKSFITRGEDGILHFTRDASQLELCIG